MNIIPNAVSRQVFRSALLLKKNSPNILFTGGLAGVVASTILACRATLKLADELPTMKGDLDAVRENITDPEEQRKAIAIVYGTNAGKVFRLYTPSVLVGAVSIGALTGSHVQLNRRNAGLTAAYAAVAKAYDDYRDRVREDLGSDRELDIYHAAENKIIELPDGKSLELKAVKAGMGSPHARFFDEASRNFQKNAEMNRIFIQCQQSYLNDLLKARGHVLLNDAYDILGFDRTPAGAILGWVLNENGDNFIDFGVFEARNDRFVNGWERVAYLDFNIDGVVYDKI